MAAPQTTAADESVEIETSSNWPSLPLESDKDLVDVGYFENDETLPSVVTFEETEPGTLSPGLRIYSRQPVLFYTRTSKRVVRARTIMKDKEGTYFEVGQTLLIPEHYEGKK